MSEPNQQASMYGRAAMATTTNMQSGQVDDDDDDVTAGEESIDNPQIRFEDAAAAMNGIQDVPSNALYVPGVTDYAPVAENGGSDQLTLSFQGEVYVFDAVSPDKVISGFELYSIGLKMFT